MKGCLVVIGVLFVFGLVLNGLGFIGRAKLEREMAARRAADERLAVERRAKATAFTKQFITKTHSTGHPDRNAAANPPPVLLNSGAEKTQDLVEASSRAKEPSRDTDAEPARNASKTKASQPTIAAESPSWWSQAKGFLSSPTRLPVKAFIVKANQEVVYLPLLRIRFGRAEEVRQHLEAAERAIRSRQEELDREAVEVMETLIPYIEKKQEWNAAPLKDKLKLLRTEYMELTSVQRFYEKLPPADITITTNDKGRATAELPPGEWIMWASTERKDIGVDEEYYWLLPVSTATELQLANNNMFSPSWAIPPAWTRSKHW